jgi:FAD binding domain
LLCIADTAHAMSPSGGIGINVGVQNAIAAANIPAEPQLPPGSVYGPGMSGHSRKRCPAVETSGLAES